VQLPERLIIFGLLKLGFDTLPHLPAMPSAGKPVGRERITETQKISVLQCFSGILAELNR